MEKMGIPLVLSVALFVATNLYTATALGSCPLKELETGAACSMQDSDNINLEKNRTVQTKVNTETKGEKDLRPIKTQEEMLEAKGGICQYSSCIYKTLLGR